MGMPAASPFPLDYDESYKLSRWSTGKSCYAIFERGFESVA